MRNVLVMIILMLTLLISLPTASFAQGIMGNTNMMDTASSTADNNHTATEETKGKDVFNKLQSKQIECKDLSEDDFEVLGEYFMGQMAGTSHEAMNTMMSQMMGEKAEEQMHIGMGKRLSGCDTNALIPQNVNSMMPMMAMMMGMTGGGNSMIGSWNGNSLGLGWSFGLLFTLFNLVLSILIIVVLTLLAIWLWKQIHKK